MSDVIKSPNTDASNQTPVVKKAASKWRVVLAVFALVSVACLIWLVSSLASISQYVTDFNQLISLPAIIFIVALIGAAYALSRLLKERSANERLLIEQETLRRRQEANVESERSSQIQEENERNQMAILRLLDELADLADGDLTVNATVSEDFTGAIADSVNFAIEQLRELVLVINETADRVTNSTEQTQVNAVELVEAS